MSNSEILKKFETLTTIPHCSYETDKMRDFLADFAKDNALRLSGSSPASFGPPPGSHSPSPSGSSPSPR